MSPARRAHSVTTASATPTPTPITNLATHTPKQGDVPRAGRAYADVVLGLGLGVGDPARHAQQQPARGGTRP